MLRSLTCALAAVLLLSAPAFAVPRMVPLRDAATGRVISLSLEGYQPNAGAAKAALSAEAVTAQARDFVSRYAGELGVSAANDVLVALPAGVDKLGLGHQRFALNHGGLPVVGGEIYVHVDPSVGVYYATVKGMGKAPASLIPALSAEDAQQAALNWAAGEAPQAATIDADEPKLVIIPLRVAGNKTANESRLAWHVRIAADDPMAFDEQCFVDAGNSEVVFHFSNNEGLNRRVLDCAAVPGLPYCYIDTWDAIYGYYWGRSENAPARGPYPIPSTPLYFGSTDVDTLHSLLATVHGYWLDVFGRDGANGQGGLGDGVSIPIDQTKTYVHLDNAWTICPYANHNSGRLSFCRGMVTPDLVGHEYTHGVVNFMLLDDNGYPAGTIYAGEAGALEESYADISAEGVEMAATGLHDWHFGTWFDTPPGTYPSCSHGIYRDLAEPWTLLDTDEYTVLAYPARFGSPDFYCGTEDSGGIHHNSTVPTYAFYLLSEGGTFNGCTNSPIGFDAALQIWYRAWTTYFTRSVTFNEAYFALQQAAADLYPQEVVDQVRIALQAVEMDQPGACSGIPAQTPACAGASAVPIDPVAASEGASIRFCGPNPSFGSATIEYALARGGEVEVAVFDVAGRRVALVVAERQERGLHQAQWRDARVPSGHYVVRLSVDGRTAATHKLMVIR